MISADPLDDVFRAPPEEFVAERTALVKSLRAAGDREQAASVAKLRRPSVAEWALNRVALDDAQPIEALLDAVDSVRSAQAAALEGGSGPDLREANEVRRKAAAGVARAAAKVLEQAGRKPDTQVAAVSDLLRRVGSSTALAAQLRAGRLGGADALDENPFGGPLPSSPPPKKRTPTKESSKGREPGAAADERRERKIADAREELAGVQQALEEAERAMNDAAGALERAEADRAKAAAALADAEQERDRCAKAARGAERERAQLDAAVARARRALEDAERP